MKIKAYWALCIMAALNNILTYMYVYFSISESFNMYIGCPLLFVWVLLKVPDIINVSASFPFVRRQEGRVGTSAHRQIEKEERVLVGVGENRGITYCQLCQLTVDTHSPLPTPPPLFCAVCLLLHFACCTSICIILIFCTRQGFAGTCSKSGRDGDGDGDGDGYWCGDWGPVENDRGKQRQVAATQLAS